MEFVYLTLFEKAVKLCRSSRRLCSSHFNIYGVWSSLRRVQGFCSPSEMESELIQSGVPSVLACTLNHCACVFIFRPCETEMKGGSWGGREEARQEGFGGGEQLHCIVRERQR